VLDATVATRRPQLAADAASAGVPVAIDPMTFLAQTLTTEEQGWSALPFGSAMPRTASDFASDASMRQMVEAVASFEIEHGASMVVPPYFYAKDPKDEYFLRSMTATKRTREYLDSNGSGMQLLPVFCGRVDGFGAKESWGSGVDWFAQRAKECGAEAVAVLLSPLGSLNDSYAKVFRAFSIVSRLQGHGLRVHVWRQGALGPALVAAGATGYETGLQYGNKTDLSALSSSRRPPKDQSKNPSGGGEGQLFLPSIGRWVLGKQAEAALQSPATKASATCDDPVRCCSSPLEMLAHRREHAVRSHGRRLAELDGMPALRDWKLYAVSKASESAIDVIQAMNKVLARSSLPLMSTKSHEALRDVTRYLGASQAAA
jgi:hypothetical protein